MTMSQRRPGQYTMDKSYAVEQRLNNLLAPASIDPWHSMNSLGYANGFTDSGSGPNGQYRLVAFPPNSVELIGDISIGTLSGNTTFVTLAAAYRPATGQSVLVTFPAIAAGPTNLAAAHVIINTTGTLQVVAFGGMSASGRFFFHAFISLDA